jgi:Putative beta-barrel porin-2, OmpL-like. bbp2
MTQLGMYSTTTPRNDASYSRGQWQLDNAYRYFSEAYGGYHFDKLHGINVDAGVFMSYVGLFSFYNFDNWAYQPSYVSSNTPWFFTGVRTQIFVTDKLKIEPWFVNGWQSYGRYNNRPGIGGQILWRPNGRLSILGNQYALGEDALNNPGRVRYHTDDSIQYLYFLNPGGRLSKAAFSLTGDMGCEHGGGVSCAGDSKKGPKQSFLGFMFYNRLWFHRDLFALTLGGGRINNPGRYLVLLPPINGATATSGTPYFTENPGDKYKAWDTSATFDYMPSQYITFRIEYNHRAADVPYFSGPGGVTPPGGNTGPPGSVVPGWAPDLRNSENRMTGAVLVMF